jgi:hypothetical protein
MSGYGDTEPQNQLTAVGQSVYEETYSRSLGGAVGDSVQPSYGGADYIGDKAAAAQEAAERLANLCSWEDKECAGFKMKGSAYCNVHAKKAAERDS